MRYILLVFGLTVVLVMAVAGKRGDFSKRRPIEIFFDMDRQPKLRPQTVTDFFADGLSSQPLVPGTIARGTPYEDTPINTGKISGTTNWVATIPVPVTAEFLQRGRERYTIYCAPCHGDQGDGKGIATRFGMTVIGELHDGATRKVIQQPDGELFNTISYGKGLMSGYAANVSIQDRWAIIAYVRALQRSRLASIEDVPADQRAALTKPLPPGAAQTK
jgi:mono/diheme cytochrome c family protein